MFLDKKKSVEADILAMIKVLDLITYKCWYYTEAVKDNSEERVKSIKPEDMPEDIKKSFENSHGDMICG
ncbi:hypothetical protein [Sediminispirochaeta bajacaliforniensis]|uniref:hypothetical protein n=1 Tax=Sediminispirochaeta bajacaliforniensis TaxID=148 RepID=UPI0003756F0E|nr:hypothetical protein [Sediminispirochaeta bajacaliforniensis]